MTVAASSTTITYNGSGNTGPFSFSWPITDESEVSVSKTSAAGVVTQLVLGADYAVSLGGSVTLTLPVNVDEKLTIASALPYDQPAELLNQGAYYPEVIEGALDRLSMQVKQVYEIAKGGITTLWSQILPNVISQVAGQITEFFTATGDVFASDYGTGATALNAAITAIGSNPRKLIVTAGNWTIDQNVAIPTNVKLEMRPGANFVSDGVHTLSGLSEVHASWFGTTDYGSSLNACDACLPAGGGTIYLPSGTLPLYTAATLTKPHRLLGEGVNITIVQKKAAVVALTWNNLVANGGEIADFSLKSDNVGTAEDGIQITSGSRLNLHDIYVTAQKGNGISFLGNNNLGRVERVISVSNGQDGIYVNGGATHDGNAMSFSNIDARSNGRDGINLDDAIDCYLLGVNAQQNGRYGIRVNSRGNYILAYAEVNTTKDYEFTAASSGNYLVATNGTPEDLGTANTIIRNVNNALYRYTMENLYMRRMLEFRDQGSYVGYFQTAISADRTLTTTFAGSSSGATARFTHASYPTGKTTLLSDYVASYTGLAPNYSTPGVQILAGTGAPNGAVTAYVGSIYLRSDGGATTTLYVKESGANTNTGWVAK